MDIIGAMEKEREYLSFRMKGEEPFHLVDAVKEYGFDTLKAFFDAKKNYEFSQLKFEVVEKVPEEAIAGVFDIIEKQKTAVLFVESDKTFVWNGNSGHYNAEYCSDCDIPIYPIYAAGGTIVSTPGDLSIGICLPSKVGANSNYILNKFAEIFRKYTQNLVEVSGNDLIVAGTKVLGSSEYYKNDAFMWVSLISLSDKKELISKICLKHSIKQPGYIDFMTQKQLKQEIEEWLKIVSF